LGTIEACFIDFQNGAPKEGNWKLLDGKAQSISSSLEAPVSVAAAFLPAPARIKTSTMAIIEGGPNPLINHWRG
jgi:hypothetical protein